MNGWADPEPAWWLNLQAHPEATVELPDGPRAVTARAAVGEERDRLWARFVDLGSSAFTMPARRCDRARPRSSSSSRGPRSVLSREFVARGRRATPETGGYPAPNAATAADAPPTSGSP